MFTDYNDEYLKHSMIIMERLKENSYAMDDIANKFASKSIDYETYRMRNIEVLEESVRIFNEILDFDKIYTSDPANVDYLIALKRRAMETIGMLKIIN